MELYNTLYDSESFMHVFQITDTVVKSVVKVLVSLNKIFDAWQ